MLVITDLNISMWRMNCEAVLRVFLFLIFVLRVYSREIVGVSCVCNCVAPFGSAHVRVFRTLYFPTDYGGALRKNSAVFV